MGDLKEHIRRVSGHYDHIAAIGPYATLAPNNHGGRKAQYVSAVFDQALHRALASGDRFERILDFGCGTGIFTRQASALAKEVVGVDVSAGVLKQAESVCQGLANVRLLQTDGASIPLPDHCVDRIIAREVLCYVPEPALPQVLAEMLRVTKPGGMFLWLDQVSDDSRWQNHPSAPNMVKRAPIAIRQAALNAGWQLADERIVRTPRFPWIYPVWFGLVPRTLIPSLAAWEVDLHAKKNVNKRRHRWWNALFVLRKPGHG